MTTVRKMPSFFGETAAGPSTVTASPHAIDSTKVCSACGNAMKPVLANKIPAYVCMQDRIVLPQPVAEGTPI